MSSCSRYTLFLVLTVFCLLQLFSQPLSAAEMRSVWVWGSTVRSSGADVVASTLQARGITDAILLVKGSAGTVAYPSAIAPAAASDDTLGNFLAACHSRGIRVHAWLNYHQDDYFGITKTNKKYSIYHLETPTKPDPYSMNDGRICPLRAKEEYNQYFLSIVDEILRKYPVDGIHLDYIRYPAAYYCFCPAHLAAAASAGIDMDHVRTLVGKTYYPAPGDGKSYFNAYAAGDADVVKWVSLRKSEINAVVEDVRDTVASYNAANQTSVALSTAMMPEGALTTMATDAARTDQLGLCHYAQSYEDMAPMLSFLAPMAYHKDYGQPPSWVGTVVAGAVAKTGATPVVAGIQVYSVTAQDIADALFAARWSGSAGFGLFRYGVSKSADQAWGTIVPTLDTLMASTQTAMDEGWIDNAGIANSLLKTLENAKKSLDQSDTKASQNQLRAYLHEVAAQSGKHIDARSARILADDAQWVLDLMK